MAGKRTSMNAVTRAGLSSPLQHIAYRHTAASNVLHVNHLPRDHAEGGAPLAPNWRPLGANAEVPFALDVRGARMASRLIRR
jgi:hypothetical protein